MKVCVVGCGPSGLVAAKYLKQSNIEFDAFERSEKIGGIWVYNENHEDSFGEPVHTAMYRNLRTNFPKELMEFKGHKYETDESFLPSAQILQYLEEYADKFKFMDNIKVGHKVKRIARINDEWIVNVEDLNSRITFTKHYSHVIICNGHHFIPRYPEIEGIKRFQGLQIHSKDYRTPEIFHNKNLLVIGFSFSGQDMTADASHFANKVFVSHHTEYFKAEFYKDNVIPKPDVKELNKNEVLFLDGTIEKIDAILYCTGYKYNFEFLDESCGIDCDGDSVKPLYRHMFNINYPSMSFVGLNFSTIVFFVFEAQANAIVKVISNEANLPSKETMLTELKKHETFLENNNVPCKKYHMVQNVRQHFQEIHDIADLKDIPQVIYNIHFFNVEKRRNFIHKYRKWVYKVLDQDNFTAYFDENKY